MREAVEAVLRGSLGVRPGERVLVIADTGTRAIGEALREVAGAVLALMEPGSRHGEEPPDAIAAALLAAIRDRKDLYLAQRLDRLSPEDLAALDRAAGILERMLEEDGE